MGECYKNDEGVCRDFVKAVEYYRKAAEQGYMEAQYELGRCYEIGLGLPSDRYQASKWYLKAAERGHAEAQYYLGKYYENLENWEMAIKWYQKFLLNTGIQKFNVVWEDVMTKINREKRHWSGMESPQSRDMQKENIIMDVIIGEKDFLIQR